MIWGTHSGMYKTFICTHHRKTTSDPDKLHQCLVAESPLLTIYTLYSIYNVNVNILQQQLSTLGIQMSNGKDVEFHICRVICRNKEIRQFFFTFKVQKNFRLWGFSKTKS